MVSSRNFRDLPYLQTTRALSLVSGREDLPVYLEAKKDSVKK